MLDRAEAGDAIRLTAKARQLPDRPGFAVSSASGCDRQRSDRVTDSDRQYLRPRSTTGSAQSIVTR